MATPEWRDTLQKAFRDGKATDDDIRAALRRGRNLDGPKEAPWEGVGYDWLSGVVFLKSAEDRLRTLRLLLDAGLSPNGGAPSFEHLPVPKRLEKWRAFIQLTHGGRPRSDARQRASLGVPMVGTESSERFHLPWLARTAWRLREQPELPQLLDLWLKAGADPHFQPNAAARAASGDPEKSRVQLAMGQAWSSWPVLLGIGRLDVLETVLDRVAQGSRPKDWAVAVAMAFEMAEQAHVPMERVVASVERFAERFPPLPEERRAVFRLLVGKGKSNYVRHPEALVGWLVSRCSELPKMLPGQKGVASSFNPWCLLGLWDKHLEVCQHRLLEALQRHPVWGTAQALRDSRVKSQSRRWLAAPEGATALDGWLVANDNPWNHGLPGLLPSLLDQAKRWAVAPSAAFPELLANQRDAPSAIATQWLASNHPEWALTGAEGKTPWHFAPERSSVLDWLHTQGVDPRQRDDHGVPGAMEAAVLYQSRRSTHVHKAWAMVDAWPSTEQAGVVLKGLPWGAWRSVSDRLPPVCRTVSAANQLQAALELNELKAVRAWVKRFPTFSWASMDAEEQHRLLMAASLSHPLWTQPLLSKGIDNEASLAKCLALLRQEKGLEGLHASAFTGWMHNAQAHNPISVTGVPPTLVEAWNWLEGVPASVLSQADRSAVVRLWWSALNIKKEADAGQSHPLEPWPWEAATWKTLGEPEKAQLAVAVLRYGCQKKHDTTGTFGRLSSQWLMLFEEHVLEGRAERLFEFASIKERKAMSRLLGKRLARWGQENGRLPEFYLAALAMYKQQQMEEALEVPSASVSHKKSRL